MGKDKAPPESVRRRKEKKTNTVTIMNIKYTLTLIGEVKPGGDITIQDHAKALKNNAKGADHHVRRALLSCISCIGG